MCVLRVTAEYVVVPLIVPVESCRLPAYTAVAPVESLGTLRDWDSPVSKYVRRRHFNPLTDGIFPFIYLDGRQTTGFECGTLGLTPLTDAPFPVTDRPLTSLPASVGVGGGSSAGCRYESCRFCWLAHTGTTMMMRMIHHVERSLLLYVNSGHSQ